ncbi:MAG: hypothetical protein ACM3N5_15800 [Candidatus Eiseniibacteriota bacterium]
MTAEMRERFEIGDRQRELRDEQAGAHAATLFGWLIVLALMLTLMAAS